MIKKLIKRVAAAFLAAALCASFTVPAYADFYRQPANKKGVLINEEAQVPSVSELGASQVITNFPISWAYQQNRLNACESFFKAMDARGISVTVIVLNDWEVSRYNPELLPVAEPAAGASYYGFNTKSSQGLQAIRDAAGIMMTNFGGLVSNWVIGNEINDGQTWNYVGPMDIDTYCSNYATSFRTWYDTIKGFNPSARVFMPFDFRWNCGQVEGYKFGVMDMLPRLNTLLKDTDYGIAWHAYPEVFTDPVFWEDKYVLEKADTYIINMKNLHILTDQMQKPEMLSPAGAVRHLILSEQGFTSVSPERGGECLELQAQCITEAYRIAAANPYVEAFFLNRMKDEEALLQVNYAFGLMDVNGNKKPSFEAYKNAQ